MIRELLDIAWLEDFLQGLGRSEHFRFGAYDRHGGVVAASDAAADLTARLDQSLDRLPADLKLAPLLPADEPPAEISFAAAHGVWHLVAPVYLENKLGGFVTVGEFREDELSAEQKVALLERLHATPSELEELWRALPVLERRGDWPPVHAARWLSRMIAEACRRELQVATTSEELALVGDMAELLHGDEDVQTVLDRIVSETARVMKVQFCSLRLLDAESGELKLAATHRLSPEYLKKGSVFPEDNPIDQDALAGKIVYIEDAATDPRVRFPEEARRQGIVSGLTAGLIYRGQAVGVVRVYTDHKQRFRAAQRKLLRAIAFQAATAIVHARMFEERLAAARTRRQLQLAGEFQTRMMRTRAPTKPQIRTAAIFQPSSDVGGDYCDFVLMADGRLAAVVADVVGKQIKASLLATYVRGALRATAARCTDVAEVVTQLNRQLCRDTLPSEFVTLLVAAVSDDGARLDFCNAGHEPILRLRGRDVTVTTPGGLVLGVSPEEEYDTATLALAPGDTCLLYTDGAIEALNFESQAYGRTRLREALMQFGDLELNTALRGIQWDIRRFSGLAEQTDDLTLVGLRVVGPT